MFIGHGSKLTIAGTTPVDVDCLSIDTGGNKIDTPESTSMLTTGTQKTYGVGLEDSGEVTVKFNFNPSDPGQMALIATKGTVASFKVSAPAGVTWSRAFSGILNSGPDYTFPDDKPVVGTVKIKITGPYTDTPSGE